jgi:hypothetical protein
VAIAAQMPKGHKHDKTMMRSTPSIILYLIESVR